ncbi:hypothetical protein LWI29_013731 [Acer saccharum]|uniref:Uncharacterized protein n=1 Tax=Acer saccharum TaxID=4024 RepID=A0AA39SAW5_ACESA|nr:hypothetical protein LWI29_013731 [Acer saccharum]
MRVQGLAANKTAHFSIILEVFEMAPTFFMVDIQKAAGDVAEYLKFYKNFCGNLEDIVWKPPNESSRTRVTVTKSKNKTGIDGMGGLTAGRDEGDSISKAWDRALSYDDDEFSSGSGSSSSFISGMGTT